MDDISIRDCKIKYIYSFFEYKYNEEISNKVLSIVDNYTIESNIGNGSFGKVFKCYNKLYNSDQYVTLEKQDGETWMIQEGNRFRKIDKKLILCPETMKIHN